MPTDLVSISIALTTVLTTRMCFPEADRDVLSDHNSRPNSDTDEEAQSPAETTQTYAAPAYKHAGPEYLLSGTLHFTASGHLLWLAVTVEASNCLVCRKYFGARVAAVNDLDDDDDDELIMASPSRPSRKLCSASIGFLALRCSRILQSQVLMDTIDIVSCHDAIAAMLSVANVAGSIFSPAKRSKRESLRKSESSDR
eukprot:TRINITY_DN11735_c1_g4_i4.p1 TRINITY_DN11735_c1_g4~~TRINITY_DN11735_c1_g4_i4.p1  ORF type:complete len:198 (-),score=13.97 TRINITY_DN11735_c1_g4_i4:459-1052(-)